MLQPRERHFREPEPPTAFTASPTANGAIRECPRVVVCVHGLTRNGRDFDTLAAALSDRFRVLCPDMPGRGESEWLPDPNDYVFPTYLTALTALLAHADVDAVSPGWAPRWAGCSAW